MGHAQDLAGQTVYVLNTDSARVRCVEGCAVSDRNVESAVGAKRQRSAGMTPRIDLDVVIYVLPCGGVEAGLGLANIAGTVDGSRSADVLKRPRLQRSDAWNSDAAEQNDFAVGNRGGVIVAASAVKRTR